MGAEAGRIAGDLGVSLRHDIRSGHAADAIVRFAEEAAAEVWERSRHL